MTEQKPAKKITPKLNVKKKAGRDASRQTSKTSKSSFVWLDGVEAVLPTRDEDR